MFCFAQRCFIGELETAGRQHCCQSSIWTISISSSKTAGTELETSPWCIPLRYFFHAALRAGLKFSPRLSIVFAMFWRRTCHFWVSPDSIRKCTYNLKKGGADQPRLLTQPTLLTLFGNYAPRPHYECTACINLRYQTQNLLIQRQAREPLRHQGRYHNWYHELMQVSPKVIDILVKLPW